MKLIHEYTIYDTDTSEKLFTIENYCIYRSAMGNIFAVHDDKCYSPYIVPIITADSIIKNSNETTERKIEMLEMMGFVLVVG